MKLRYRLAEYPATCRPPRGGRGLKLWRAGRGGDVDASPPARGAWIETLDLLGGDHAASKSPPARGAWIETAQSSTRARTRAVAPRAGGVD